MRRLGVILFVTSVLAPVAATGQPLHPWTVTVQVARSFPRMTAADDQIREINGVFGTSLADWSSVANASLGVGLWRPVGERLAAGVQLDLSRTSLDGSQQVGPVADGQRLSFTGRHGLNLQLRAALEYRPCFFCRVAAPFVRVGLGLAYVSDERTLTLSTAGSSSSVSARSSGVVPASLIGAGVDTPFGITNAWRIEVGGAYTWAKLSKTVPTSGALLDISEARLESDLSGPLVWIGVSYRF